MKLTMKWMTMVTLCLTLPICALAVTEGVVEDAPSVEMEQMHAAEASYLPDASCYAGYGNWTPAWEHAPQWVESPFDGECYHDVEQRPRMTAGEAARAKALLAEYQAGKIAYTGESILNKMEDVVVGVYALNPIDYAGEQAYVILPGPCMTDEQILAVIDAYAQLGLTFDPDALCTLNCARGGGIETNRFLTETERTRYQNLARLIDRGLLDVSFAADVQVMQPRLDSRYFCGLPDFTIRPYRAATDEEFVALLANLGYHDKSGEVDYDNIEKESRSILCGRLGAALSMELSYIYHEGTEVPVCFDKNGRQGQLWNKDAINTCGASFEYCSADGFLVYADTSFDRETMQLIQASITYSRRDSELYMTQTVPAHEAIMEELNAVEAALNLPPQTWHVHIEDETWTNWGQCIPVRAMLSETPSGNEKECEWLTVYIGKDDGKARGLRINCGTLMDVLPDACWPDNG